MNREREDRGRAVAATMLAAVVAVLGAGFPMNAWGLGAGLGVLTAVTAASVARPRGVAAAACAGGALIGLAVRAAIVGDALTRPSWVLTMMTVVVAGVAALGVHGVASRFRSHAATSLRVLMVVLPLVAMAYVALFSAMHYPSKSEIAGAANYGIVTQYDSANQLFEVEPVFDHMLADEEVYLAYYHALRSGADYYATGAQALGSNPGRWDPTSPLSYRQPLLYRVMAALGSGTSVVLAFIALTTLACVLGYLGASAYLRPQFAALTPLAIAAYSAGVASSPGRLLHTEPWAGLLVAGAVFSAMLSLRARAHALAHAWSAAGAMLAFAAMSTRELAFLHVAVITAAIVVDDMRRRRWLWSAWAVSIALFALVYLAHVRSVASAVASAHLQPLAGVGFASTFLHPSLVSFAHTFMAGANVIGGLPVMLLLLACALVGAWAVRAAAQRILVGGVVGLSALLLLLTGTKGIGGVVYGYWGPAFMPSIVGLASFAAMCWHGARSRTDA